MDNLIIALGLFGMLLAAGCTQQASQGSGQPSPQVNSGKGLTSADVGTLDNPDSDTSTGPGIPLEDI